MAREEVGAVLFLVGYGVMLVHYPGLRSSPGPVGPRCVARRNGGLQATGGSSSLRSSSESITWVSSGKVEYLVTLQGQMTTRMFAASAA
jgi:hypothetical protein